MEWISNEGEDCKVGERFANSLIQLDHVKCFLTNVYKHHVVRPILEEEKTWMLGRKEVMRLLLRETVETVGRLPRKPKS